MADQWLSIVEYARCFNISDMTVRRRIKNGRLEAVLREGKYYIPMPTDEGVQSLSDPVDSDSHNLGRNHKIQGGRDQFRELDWHDENYDQFRGRGNSQRMMAETTGVGTTVPQRRFSSHHEQHKSRNFQRTNTRVERSPLRNEIAAVNKSPNITKSTEIKDSVTFKAQSLFDLCENSIKKLHEQKELLEGSYKDKFLALDEKNKSLEAQISERDLRISHLNQKNEDLQLLVKIIEGSQKMRA